MTHVNEQGGKGTEEWLGSPPASASLWPLPPERYISRSQGPSGSEYNGRETGNTPCHLCFASQTLNELWYYCEFALSWDGGNYIGTTGFDLNKGSLRHLLWFHWPKQDPKHPICIWYIKICQRSTYKWYEAPKCLLVYTFHCCSLHLNLLSRGFMYPLDTQDINFPSVIFFQLLCQSHAPCIISKE